MTNRVSHFSLIVFKCVTVLYSAIRYCGESTEQTNPTMVITV